MPLSAQVDNVGAGHAISFDGQDDYIDLGNIYDNLTLPFTISAWVYVDPTSTLPGPVFASQDNADLYNGFWFFAAKSEIIFEYGDGFGANSPAYRQGKKSPIPGIQGKWTHVCGVMRSAYDVQVYINGINVGGNSSGSSPYPMSSNFPGDVAKIGYFLSNG
ncbi:MAG TPA: LamG-like jellyroll fold domain-containing protein, partial [Chryseolinea sp.]